MTREELLDVFKKSIITTPDGRLIGDKENRFNTYMSSYTGESGLVYTFPRKIRWPDGYPDKRDIFNDRSIAVGKLNKPTKLILERTRELGLQFDLEVLVWIEDKDRELWLSILKKHGLTQRTIKEFEKKYKDKVLEKNYFKKYLNKRYIRLDFFDPIRHLNLEHDGSCWHVPELDEARDEFLKTKFPTIQIVRIMNYTNKKSDELKEIMNQYLEPSYPDPLVFRYDQEIISQQLEEYHEDLEYIINYLERGYKLENIQNELAIELSRYVSKNPSLQNP